MFELRSSIHRSAVHAASAVALALSVPLWSVAAPPAAGVPAASATWLRYPAISPDGKEIAFSHQGSLFVVPTQGGTARLLVANGSYNFMPRYSPDGRHIAFASDVNGNFDVYVVPAQGGAAQRLTTHSAAERPLGFTADGQAVLFAAERGDVRTSLAFPQVVGEVYRVGLLPGQRPQQVLGTPAMAASYSRTGKQMLYEDWKGYEDDWRKHHISPVARDVWLYDTASNAHRKLTDWGGENRNPVWAPDQQAFYYLSEQSGSFNVWRKPLAEGAKPEQITRLAKHPVRFLSGADDGTLCFGFDGGIYTLPPGATEPKPVAITIAADTQARRIHAQKLSKGATEMAVSPSGQEVAFVIRGEVFVASVEFGDTRRITTTPGAERSVSFSPDGRRLLFAGEEGGSWNLYEARLPEGKKAERDVPHFFSAAQVPVSLLLKNGKENFQPAYSPDGKEVAYLENRSTIKVLNLASGQTRTVMPGEMSYSYQDGDQWFAWSPDGRSLLATFIDRNRWGAEIALLDAQGKTPPLNITQSGYEDTQPLWARGGQMMVWLSDRMGLHGTGGAAQRDVYGMFFTREAWDRYRLSKAEFAQLKKQEEDEQDDDGGKKKEGDDKGEPKKQAGPKLAKPVAIERDNLQERSARLTLGSASIKATAITPDGETLLYVAASDEGDALWMVSLREHSVKQLASFEGEGASGGHSHEAEAVSLALDAKGETAFVLAGDQIQHFKVPKSPEDEAKLKPVAYSAELSLDRSAERTAMFEHVWRQTREKLYLADMDGVDWLGYRRVYERFLPSITNNHDFAELLSEMLGELNVSHTGSGYRPKGGGGDATAALGLFFDEAYSGAGIRVTEVLTGGPLDTATSRVRAGTVIEAIGGQRIAAGQEWDSALNRQAGKRIELALFDPASGKRWSEVVKPIPRGEEGELLYKRWVRSQRDLVDTLSNGRLGYVHVRGMDDDSYRDVVSEALGRHSGKEALVVDTRYNGGGNLHDELAVLLTGQRYLEFVPRGQTLGWEPVGRWTKPSVVLVSESNYSDAHLFPWVYKHFKIGQLVGMPVAGTGTAVWWETLQDDTLHFGIPEVGFRDAKGEYMEKARVEPDIRVPQDPALLVQGRDLQLEAAVKALLKR